MIHIAICDDEPIFLQEEKAMIEQYMKKAKYSFHVDLFTSGKDILAGWVKSKRYDVVFLDINMEQMDGMELAKQIRSLDERIYIVFVTAFISYSPEGYKVGAIRYLLKDSHTLEQSICECMDVILRKMKTDRKIRTFSFWEGNITLALDSILYIESRMHKLYFHINKGHGRIYSMYEKLDTVDLLLRENGFCRIHKSCLVNMKYVKMIKRYYVKLEENVFGEDNLKVSQSRYGSAKEKFIIEQGDI